MTQDTTVPGKDNGKLTSRRRNLHRIKSNVHDFSRSGVYGLGRTIKRDIYLLNGMLLMTCANSSLKYY